MIFNERLQTYWNKSGENMAMEKTDFYSNFLIKSNYLLYYIKTIHNLAILKKN